MSCWSFCFFSNVFMEINWNITRSCCLNRFQRVLVDQFRSFCLQLSLCMQIKADVETQGEFVNSLIREVNNAVYQNIEDVVAFVKWLDDELCFLVS